MTRARLREIGASSADALSHPGPGRPGGAGDQAEPPSRGLDRSGHPLDDAVAPAGCSRTEGESFDSAVKPEIPMKERTAKGTAIVNLLNLQPSGMSIQADRVDRRHFPIDKFLVFASGERHGEEERPSSPNTTSHDAKAGSRSICETATAGSFGWSRPADIDDLMMVTPTVAANGHSIQLKRKCARWVATRPACAASKLREGHDHAISLDVVRRRCRSCSSSPTPDSGKRVKTERISTVRVGGGQGAGAGDQADRCRARIRRRSAFMVRLDDEVLLVSSGGVLIRTRRCAKCPLRGATRPGFA